MSDDGPTPTCVYHSGTCRVVSYGAHCHELWCSHQFVASFRTFRAAVKYLCEEFS